MKNNTPLPPLFVWAAIGLLGVCLNLHAQTVPTTTPPTSQTNLAGSTVYFSVTATGTGPLSYQWQLNGTNIATDLITTVAGNGTGTNAGDGGTATLASLYNPAAVALDALGNQYIADRFNNRVRRVDANGIITTVAGNGSATYAGDGGPATNASLYYPQGVAVDAAGNVYIADSYNNCVRKMDTSGIIVTIAGNGTGNYSGDGGPATNATLNLPFGLAFDATGDLYVGDWHNNRVRKIDSTGIITTVAGQAAYGYSGDGGEATNTSLYAPAGLAFDASGNLYIADYANSRIREVGTNGIISTVAGNGGNGGGSYGGDGGAATNAGLAGPNGVAFDAQGNLYIADSGNNRIRRVDANGIITTVAGNGGAGYSGDGGAVTSAGLNNPFGLTLDPSGNLYIADLANNRLREVWFGGNPQLTLTNISTNNAGNYTVVVTDPYGSVTSSVAALTVVLPPAISTQPAPQTVLGGSNAVFGVTTAGTPPFNYSWYYDATNLVQSGTNNLLLLTGVADSEAGAYSVVISNAYAGATSHPAMLTVWPLEISGQPASQSAPVGTNPSFSAAVAGTAPFGYAWYFDTTNLVQNGENNTLILPDVSINELGNYTVVITNTYGSVTSQVAALTVGFPPSVTTQPGGLIIPAGSSDAFYVNAGGTGPFTYQWQFDGTNLPANIITTVAGNGAGTLAGDGGAATNASLYYPIGMAFDAFGNLYISDSSNNRIRKVDTNGIITTVAGKGSTGQLAGGYSGDGGAATNATLNYPHGLGFDAAGNLYFSDSLNNRVRKITTNGIITTVAGAGAFSDTGDGGPATSATLSYPISATVDAYGNLYIAEIDGGRVRKVNTNGIITTAAGTGTNGYSGDGGSATNALLREPTGVFFDATGNLYVDDSGNSCIRKVNTNGIITTVAGNGTKGYSGDGGAATNANLSWPASMIIDNFGNMYISDNFNNRIRRVDPNGIITTVAGDSSLGSNQGTYSGDGGPPALAGLDAPNAMAFDQSGYLVFADSENNRIRRMWLNDGYPSLEESPAGTNPAGNYDVVITSPFGSVTSTVVTLAVVLPVQPAAQTVLAGGNATLNVTVAGSPPFNYSWYFDATNLIQMGTNTTLTLPAVGESASGIYTVEVSNSNGVASESATVSVVPAEIIAQPASQGAILGTSPEFSVTMAGAGPFSYAWYFNATNLVQSGPSSALTLTGVTTNSAGNYLVVITNGYGGVTSVVASLTVLLPPTITVQPAGKTNQLKSTVSFSVTVAGNGPFTYQWQLNGTNLPNNDIYISTVAGNGAQNLSNINDPPDGSYSGDGGQAVNAALNGPAAVIFDSPGNMYISDSYNNRVRKVTTNGIITTIAGNGTASYTGDNGAATNASLNSPQGLSFDASGNLYVADTSNSRVREVGANGIITTVAGNGGTTYSGDGGPATSASLNHPLSTVFDISGNLYIADASNNRIREAGTNGIIITFAGNGLATDSGDGFAATNASFFYPAGLSFDGSGNLYIADNTGERIRRVNKNGIVTTVVGNGRAAYAGDGGPATNASLDYPNGLALDASGRLYIADTDNSRVRATTPGGIITTVAGNGNNAFAGDNGLAVNASLYDPAGVGLSPAGNLYIADKYNNRIREVHLAEGPAFTLTSVSITNAGNYTVVVTSPYGSVISAVATLTVAAPPVVTLPPASQSVMAGSSPSFSVGVAGSGPFGYNWYFAGATLVQSSASNTLSLPLVSTKNAGNYTVVITNNYGSVTSTVASLTVTISTNAPQILTSGAGFGFLANQFGFNLNGAFGQTIVIDGSTDLVTWLPLFTNTASGAPFYFFDPAWTNFPARFYRARLP